MDYSEIQKLMKEYNWDNGFELPEKILQELECDLALALEIFYLGDGFSYLWNELEDCSQWKEFIEKLYQDILAGRYLNKGKSFAVPLTKVQKYHLKKSGCPQVFLTDLCADDSSKNKEDLV